MDTDTDREPVTTTEAEPSESEAPLTVAESDAFRVRMAIQLVTRATRAMEAQRDRNTLQGATITALLLKIQRDRIRRAWWAGVNLAIITWLALALLRADHLAAWVPSWL